MVNRRYSGGTKKRSKMRLKKSKRLFRKTANLSHWKNFADSPMRGGIRM